MKYDFELLEPGSYDKFDMTELDNLFINAS